MHQRLRILHVVDSLETGGLERVVADLCVAQRAAGEDVTVFSIEATGGFRDELEATGTRVVVGNKRGALDRNVLASLRRTAVALGADIVHTHNFVPNYYAALATLALRRAPAIVNTCHNMGTRLANRRLRWLYALSIRRTARVAMVSRQVRDRLIEMGLVAAAKAPVVLNGIPVERFGIDARRRADARRALGVAEDAALIGCVGRLVPVKNHAALIGEMPALAVRHPKVALVIVGDGPLRAELAALCERIGVADRVVLAGDRKGVSDLLAAFDIYAQPSLSEGMSIALLEASASGLAIVATAVGGNPDIVEDRVTGRLVPIGDGAALRTALGELLDDDGMRARLGEAAQRWCAAHASIAFMRDAYDALYRDALEGHVASTSDARANG